MYNTMMYAFYQLFLNADDDTMQKICNVTGLDETDLAVIFSEAFEGEA